MNRREALLGKFRAGSIDRIRRLNARLVELEEGRGAPADLAELARELHTFKGEARMLNQAAIGNVTHATEELLESCAVGAASGPRFSRARLALEAVARVLRGEIADGPATEEALGRACKSLLEATSGEGQAAVEPAASASPSAPPSAPALAPAPPVAGEAASPGAAAADRWVPVQARHVDELCERVNDFTSDFAPLYARLRLLYAIDADARARDAGLLEDFDRCRSRLDELSAAAWSLRLVPIEPLLQELAAHARELARGQSKRVRVQIRGGATQVERSVLESLSEPLLHLVRNAVDHGVEAPEERAQKGKDAEAVLTLQADAVGPNAVLSLSDDGRGIDLEAVRAVAVRRSVVEPEAVGNLSDRGVLELLFRHGFSTRTEVGELSGRGVGLDVVREALQSLGGSVALTTDLGKGTRFALTIPTRISKERALVVSCGDALLGIPSRQVVEIVRMGELAPQDTVSGRAVRYGGELLPLRSLAALGGAPPTPDRWGIILESDGRRWALGVSALAGDQDVVRRPADAALSRLGYVAASAMLDDGRLVLVVGLTDLLRRIDVPQAGVAAPAAGRNRRVLVVDDSPVIRELVSGVLRGAGIEVEVASDGRAALKLLEQRSFDAVVSDVEMPGMSGVDLLAHIRNRLQTLPVIMLTTRASAEDRLQATALGADAYLIKADFRDATLLEVVRRYVGEAR